MKTQTAYTVGQSVKVEAYSRVTLSRGKVVKIFTDGGAPYGVTLDSDVSDDPMVSRYYERELHEVVA